MTRTTGPVARHSDGSSQGGPRQNQNTHQDSSRSSTLSAEQDESPSHSPLEDQLGTSWRRSAALGLTPQSARPGSPDPAGIRSHRLAEAARPVMDGLDAMLKGTGALILLGDRDGRIIRTARDDAPVSRKLRRIGIEEGALLAEDLVGNNGIGTALETRRGVSIHGSQHFAETLKDFVCYGHPIVDPLTRRLVGAVDLTGLDVGASRMFAPFVRKIVADIEARYVDTARADDRELWHRFVERTRNSDTATCAFGDEVVLASRSSLERLDFRDITTLRRLVERDEMGDSVELSSGTVRLTANRVGGRGHLLDLAFPDDLTEPGPQAHVMRRRQVPAVDREREASARVQAMAQHEKAAAARVHAVTGPAGSGKSTTARSIAGADAMHVRLSEADDSATAWNDLAVPALRSATGPLILDDVDLLDDSDLRRLAAKLAGRGSTRAGLVVVTSREDPRTAVTEVLDTCGARTELRPLHERSDSTAIVERAMADLCAERGIDRPPISDRFAEAACTADLPNGLTSLRSILAECLDKGSARLDVDSLPSRARSARPPRSGELARGEYDAIVAALAECDGVRSHAAKRLGISRTTLYSRMREFGLF